MPHILFSDDFDDDALGALAIEFDIEDLLPGLPLAKLHSLRLQLERR